MRNVQTDRKTDGFSALDIHPNKTSLAVKKGATLLKIVSVKAVVKSKGVANKWL